MHEVSTRSLRDKLGVRPGDRLRLIRVPADVRRQVGWSPRAGGPTGTPVEFALVFARSRQELFPHLPRLAASLTPAGALWVAWPKRSSGATTDLSDSVVRALGVETGLVDVKVASVTPYWSGLRFVRRRRDRPRSRTG
jgi:hypothetical protein